MTHEIEKKYNVYVEVWECDFFIVPVKIHTIFKYFMDFQHIFNKNMYQNTFFVKNHTIFKYFIDFQHIFNKNMSQNIFFDIFFTISYNIL